jgi:hypothetical protein
VSKRTCTGGCRIISHDFAQTRREVLATSWLHRPSETALSTALNTAYFPEPVSIWAIVIG